MADFYTPLGKNVEVEQAVFVVGMVFGSVSETEVKTPNKYFCIARGALLLFTTGSCTSSHMAQLLENLPTSHS